MKKLQVTDLAQMRARDEKIAAITAYDFTFARLFDAHVELILVGDSLGNVIQGHSTTLPVTLDEMIYHSRAVVRGTRRAFVVADLPFLTFQLGPLEALRAAGRLVKEAGVQAVKLEGGKHTTETVQRVVHAGIPVMGHVGLTPQSYHQLGGHRMQGKEAAEAESILAEAVALEDAGAFSVVLEAIPADLAGRITKRVGIPTIGIGAGPSCSGQILVSYDLLALTAFPGDRVPKFVRQYAQLGETVEKALGLYADDVKTGSFPGQENST